jgi:hypothetical protein
MVLTAPVGAPRSAVAAIRFFYPPHDGIVERVQLDEARLPASVDVARPLASPGQRLVLPPNDHVSCRYAYAVVRGESAAACDEAAGAPERAFEISVNPADAAVASAS